MEGSKQADDEAIRRVLAGSKEDFSALVARYHDESAPRGRWHRLVIAAHPSPAVPSGRSTKES